ncbi:hypothetical protein HS088_TW13G01650 [Tripterygium wilfordii]|uniref:Uncharacterized protein n=1 Tax=Tripterygium wilfordii TaxID=458696 RepID=A0A7J7CXR7_TRIWF|nr:hypothetical protein HS088_TW13G01650 [Tripterygium wilfordii]
MASEQAKTGKLDASTSSNQEIPADKEPNTKGTTNITLGKALAQRALYGSQPPRRRAKGRKVANTGAGLLPSRLSKVSLADNPED